MRDPRERPRRGDRLRTMDQEVEVLEVSGDTVRARADTGEWVIPLEVWQERTAHAVIVRGEP